VTGEREHLYLSNHPWHGLWIIQQPVCNEIQRTEPVLYVERPVSVFTVLRYPALWRRLFAWLRGARRVTPNLRVLAPLPLFHLGHRFPWLFRIEFEIQRWWILLWARRRAPNRVLWIDHPIWAFALGRMGERQSVYHVADEPAHFPTSHSPTIHRLEARVLAHVDVVFAAADALAEARRPSHPRVHAIQNAIDVTDFSAPDPADAFLDIDAIPEPRVVFVGVIDRWVDLDLMARVVDELPDVRLLVVGVSRVDLTALRRRDRVHVLGLRPRRLIPGVLRRCRASLVPFRHNPLTANIVPAKIWEALAAGVPPVCTAFSRNLEPLAARGLVMLADDANGFVARVREAVAGDSPARRDRLRDFGLRQTWRARWEQMDALLRAAAAR
jgi:glycosyltransferase involved in cell wall biosynthesis